jgi:hypothetical protein
MTRHRVANAAILLRKRELRAEIARTRHDATVALAALQDERRRLTSWKTYVRRYPWAMLGVSFGMDCGLPRRDLADACHVRSRPA